MTRVEATLSHALGNCTFCAGPALPDVFLRYQQQLWSSVDHEALLTVEKSRRTGFSWALGAIAAGTAGAAKSAGGMDVLYMGYEKEMTREFIDYVAEFAKIFQLVASEVEEFIFRDPERPEKDIGAFRIRFASGFEVVALPSVARALRGKQGLVLLDEAAFMDDLEEVLKAALALLIWGGRVVVCSTHNGEANPFNTLINDIRAGRRSGKVMRLTFQEAIDQGLYKRICLKHGEVWSKEAEDAWIAKIRAIYRDNAEEELDVIPNPISGVYLPGVLLDARADPSLEVLRWTAPPGFTLWPEQLRKATIKDWCDENLLPILATLSPDEAHCLGEDFGRIRDLTVLWLLAIQKNLMRRTKIVVELRGVPHEQQRDIVFYMLDRVPKFRAAIFDAGGNGSYIAEAAMQRYGERVLPLQLTEPWYRENMPPFKAALEDAMMTLPADREVQDDLRMLKLVRGVARVPERRLNDEKQSRHGDAAIAAALAYAASRMEPEDYGYEAARPKLQALFGGGAGTRTWSDRPDEDEDRRPARGILPDMRGGL